MTAKTPRELFVALLSDVRHNTEKADKAYQEIASFAQDPRVKEAAEARAFIAQNSLEKLDQCFKLINEKPMKPSGRFQDAFIEEFKRELADIQSPEARHLYILAKLVHLSHFRIGEYVALVSAADISGHYAVGTLLESCLGEKVAFVDRTRRLIQHMIETRIADQKHAA
jgi:ferritin-like metal-binding protein YciE